MTNNQSDEFVFCAPSCLGILSYGRLRTIPELFNLTNDIIAYGIQKIKKELKNIDYPMLMSLLYNAATEKQVQTGLENGNARGFDRIYSDSGGLQIVTVGMSITPSLKKKVYAVQARSDIAMCFDEIPVRVEGHDQRKSSKNSLSRVFHFEDFERCAKATALNVIEQIDTFTRLNSKTKVIYIVQGNTIDDMMLWFKIATEVIPHDYWENIQGIAIAGSSMGIGQLENIEKLIAYSRIKNEFDPWYVKNHLHILGVGAVSRLQSLVILRNTGLIGPDVHVSYDSASLSLSYVLGRFVEIDGICPPSSPLWENIFKFHYNRTSKIFKEFGFTQSELDELYPLILSDALCHKKVYSDNENDRLMIIRHCHKCLSNMYQLIEFTTSMYNMNLIWDKGNTPVHMLKQVFTIEDFDRWKAQYAYAIPSSRIPRKGASLDNFFTLENTHEN